MSGAHSWPGLAAGADSPRALRLVGLVQREVAVIDAAGIAPAFAQEALTRAAPSAWPASLARVREEAARPTIVVDATASAELAREMAALLAAGLGVVTANKLPLSLPWRQVREMHKAAGAAGAPFLAVRRRSGLVAFPSCGPCATSCAAETACAASTACSRGRSRTCSLVFMPATPCPRRSAPARARGLTEPDPRVDLSGEDVARKLLIVLREAGLPVERADLEVEPLEGDDGACEARARAAAGGGRRLVHVAAWDGGRARVGVRAVDAGDPLARTRPGENVAVVETDRYTPVPLTLCGPGAGPELTAANLLSDVLEAARGFRECGAQAPSRDLPRRSSPRRALPHGASF